MFRIFLTFAALLPLCAGALAQQYQAVSPDGHITLSITNRESLSYSVSLDGRMLVFDSPMGFEFQGEEPMGTGMEVTNRPKAISRTEDWKPVVRNKFSEISVPYNEITLKLREKSGERRMMDVIFRISNDGVAFRYNLFGASVLGQRYITKELTGFNLSDKASLWIPKIDYYDKDHPYRSSQEGPYVKTPIKDMREDIISCIPGLVETDGGWLALMQADLNDFPAYYLGVSSPSKDGKRMLETRLTPIYGQAEKGGIKSYFDHSQKTPWRVIMVSDNPCRFIESEFVKSLNPECKIQDTSWIKPGMCAWDHWWSGEVKMEMPTIKQYIDFASHEGWPYMLIDWQWYGPYDKPEADITKPAPQIDMPELLRYAKEKNVRLWLWIYSSDVNRNDAYKKAFKLYEQWGVAGIKIDFMDRDDKDMVNWYRRIIKAAADHHLMVDFHGAYAPDGIERTYPNMLTREGVMGNEYYKFSDKMSPEHNVTLAFTRMLAGPMDYTPGGFLNVTQQEFKQQTPALVANTRAAELAKFVVYDSPYTVFCDHPDNVIGQDGEDFVREVPTEWDDTKVLCGAPDEFIVIAKRNGTSWYIGGLNNSKARKITLDLSGFLKDESAATIWMDAKDSAKKPTRIQKKSLTKQVRTMDIDMAGAGGFVMKITN